MFGSGIKFYDEQGNFDNRKLLKLLEMAKRAKRKKITGKSRMSGEIILFGGASKKEVWQFINRFSIFVNSGLDVKGALGILIKQTKNPYFRKIIVEIRENIDHGTMIHNSMGRYPHIFDPLTVALVGVGEKTGLLGKILNDLDKNLLESLELKSRIRGAMIYPAILLFLTISMVTGMMVFIVPRIAGAFAQQGVELPGMTKAVIAVSDFIKNEYMLILLVLIGIYTIYKLVKTTYQGKLAYAKIAMNLPIFGFIVRQSNIVYFIKSFSTLLDSGVLLLESIKTSSRVVPNLAYKREVVRIKNEVEFGLTISKSLGLNLNYEEGVYLNKYFPEEFAYIVSTGEETGTLSESVKKMGINYNKELKRYIGNLSTMIEPLIIVIVGGLVGTIVIAIMLPFFQLGKVVQNM
ncbi:type II secretion system F family protein [Candidatus Gracilibacteria bacterium]|nr:MAG: type II secretion system F family protein [Candidatus Gracilibacteria bacterium]